MPPSFHNPHRTLSYLGTYFAHHEFGRSFARPYTKMPFLGPSFRKQGVYGHEQWTPVGYPMVNTKYHYNVKDIFVEGNLTETYLVQANIERQVSYIFIVPPTRPSPASPLRSVSTAWKP